MPTWLAALRPTRVCTRGACGAKSALSPGELCVSAALRRIRRRSCDFAPLFASAHVLHRLEFLQIQLRNGGAERIELDARCVGCHQEAVADDHVVLMRAAGLRHALMDDMAADTSRAF